ncbi:MAG: CarD family transcriptional regulator [Clostridia bacterium]|nr:CarD family transcriptional regulator [Clostridia bacterium]
MFKIGDQIVHPMHGAGFIEGVEMQTVGGVQREYYDISLLGGKIRLKFPVENSGIVRLRPLVDAKRAQELMHHFNTLQIDMSGPWSKRYKENIDRIKKGDPEEVVEVIKTLMLRDKMVGLSTGDRQMMVMAKNILCSELAMVMQSDVETIFSELQDAIKNEMG